ncbi:MAG: protein-L-isoaspartate O-methyltransferase [Armatimonadetes bacterium CG2_30_66_41]|nr:MAG: protein-L-isoaspartate O-methyltransferase [Armatimonadetes bacterium CG2_30_66_41]
MVMTSSRDGACADHDSARKAMVENQLRNRDLKDARVLQAMLKVGRHRFVPADQVPHAYEDRPLPLGEGQTISQPYIAAFMTEKLAPKPTDVVLEIGTGSGYQAAVLAELVKHVYTVEIVETLAKRAKATLADLGYTNVTVRAGDGYKGWAEHAPFDAVIVTCAPAHIPQPLVDQLKEGGRMVIPVGDYHQELVLLEKKLGEVEKKEVLPVVFVPMTGEAMRK